MKTGSILREMPFIFLSTERIPTPKPTYHKNRWITSYRFEVGFSFFFFFLNSPQKAWNVEENLEVPQGSLHNRWCVRYCRFGGLFRRDRWYLVGWVQDWEPGASDFNSHFTTSLLSSLQQVTWYPHPALLQNANMEGSHRIALDLFKLLFCLEELEQ